MCVYVCVKIRNKRVELDLILSKPGPQVGGPIRILTKPDLGAFYETNALILQAF